ncbi:MAG: aminoglycoside 6-adenylyltransferase [Chloroflexi bacterium]|nr:aminoglycoside 6-adenylyltransferase [Chloroflexota bacterium]
MTISHPYLDRVKQWAKSYDSIRALVLTGSLARDDGTVDEYSDLDVQVIATDIKRFTSDDSWLDRLGDVWIRFPIFDDSPYRLVWFKGGAKVDFQFLSAADVQAIAASGALPDEYQRGYQVLVDKDGLFRRLPPSPRIFPQPPKPSPEQVQALINEFWFEAIHVAQFIRRREFWVVKHRDWTMKENLLRMLEWRARASPGEPINTWLLGKRIARWADADSQSAISQIWAGWDAVQLWEALFAQLALFQRLTAELSDALGYSYEAELFRDIEAYIRRLRREDISAAATD